MSMKMVAKVVFIVALLHVPSMTHGFLPPTSVGPAMHPFGVAHAPKSPTELKISFTSIKNSVKKLFKRSKEKVEELDDKISSLEAELFQKADKALFDLEEYLIDSMKRKSEEITNDVAVEIVKVLNGDWDVAIATDRNETSKMMEGAIDSMSQDLADLGLANNTADTKDALRESRLSWTTSWDATTYPLKVENNIYVGTSKAITFFGQFQFDILEHKAVFSLDELVVFGVKVDLESVIEEANADEETKEEKEEEKAETVAVVEEFVNATAEKVDEDTE